MEVLVRPRGVIYVLTGERGSGKSTVCAKVAREAAQGGLTVAGILTERGEDPGPGSARRVVDVRTWESWRFGSQDTEHGRDGLPAVAAPLAPPVAAPDAAGATPGISDPLTPGWKFDSGVFSWANEVLSRSTPCDLLVIDEVGPIELLGGRGWVKAVEAVCSGDYHLALVVCRPALLAQLEERIGRAPSLVLEVTAETRDDIPGVIAAEALRSAARA
jgi:nucleoside-triphosphatase THEP1